MNRLDTPVVLLLFKRREASLHIIERLAGRALVGLARQRQHTDGSTRALVCGAGNVGQQLGRLAIILPASGAQLPKGLELR